jgi:hypothetical protein
VSGVLPLQAVQKDVKLKKYDENNNNVYRTVLCVVNYVFISDHFLYILSLLLIVAMNEVTGGDEGV